MSIENKIDTAIAQEKSEQIKEVAKRAQIKAETAQIENSIKRILFVFALILTIMTFVKALR